MLFNTAVSVTPLLPELAPEAHGYRAPRQGDPNHCMTLNRAFF